MKKIYYLSSLLVLLILWSSASAITPDFTRPFISGPAFKGNNYYKTTPVIGTVDLPLNRIFPGINEVPVTNVQAVLTDNITGEVNLSWDCTPSAGFLYYIIKREAVQIAVVPAATNYTDLLPTFGNYTYCVEAFYSTGTTTPDCDLLEWPNPTLTWSPAALIATVWTNTSRSVSLHIINTGLGTLAFEFPDYVDHSGDNPQAYCTATSTACDDYIGNIKLGTINNTSGCTNYGNYSAISTDLVKGLTYPMTVTNGGNPYGSDYLYVWIDYDHNNVFDASELTQLATLGGGSNFSGNIAVPAGAMSGLTTMRVRLSYNTAANACGSQTYGEVEDYSVNIKAPTFITAVVPASGFVAAGATINLIATFNATGNFALQGVYTDTLELHSNDPLQPTVGIPATMIVGLPAILEGSVTDGVSGEPLNGALVSAGGQSAMTNETGNYYLNLNEGTYDVSISKVGYQTVNIVGVVASGGNTTTLNAAMFQEPYPPACATAAVNFEDTECVVSWCLPSVSNELIYDDGTAENYAVWNVAGNMNAVKFTPDSYPARVSGAKIYVGDGSSPAGGVFMGSSFYVLVKTPDANGLPGTTIDSVAAMVNNLGWVNVAALNATVTSGDFFIVIIQTSAWPNSAPLGVDETPPLVNKSYSRDVGNGGEWEVSAYQDFMIRAIVSSPDSVDMYNLYTDIFGSNNPVAPTAGAYNQISNSITGTTFTESGSTWIVCQKVGMLMVLKQDIQMHSYRSILIRTLCLIKCSPI